MNKKTKELLGEGESDAVEDLRKLGFKVSELENEDVEFYEKFFAGSLTWADLQQMKKIVITRGDEEPIKLFNWLSIKWMEKQDGERHIAAA